MASEAYAYQVYVDKNIAELVQSASCLRSASGSGAVTKYIDDGEKVFSNGVVATRWYEPANKYAYVDTSKAVEGIGWDLYGAELNNLLKENKLKFYAVKDTTNLATSELYEYTDISSQHTDGLYVVPSGGNIRILTYLSTPKNVLDTWNIPAAGKCLQSPNFKCRTGSCILVAKVQDEPPAVVKYTVTAKLDGVTADPTNPTEVEENTEFTLKYTANSGYKIDKATCNIGTVNIAQNKLSVTITGTATENITVNVSATQYISVTLNLTNIKRTKGYDSYEYGSLISMEFAADDGYTIDTLSGNYGSVTINPGRKTATLTATALKDLVVTGTGKYEPKTYKATYNLDEHIKGDPNNPTTLTEGKDYTFKFTCDEGWMFGSYKVSQSTGVTTVQNEEHTEATTTYKSAYAGITFDITQFPRVIPKVLITGTLKNCTCNYTNNEVIVENKDIVITADTGYEFKNQYTYLDYNIENTMVKSDDRTTLTIPYSSVSQLGNIELNDNYVATVPVETIGGFCNLYKVTEKELTQLSKARFDKDVSAGTIIDYGSAITQLYILPLAIPAELIGDKSNIILGSLDSKVESTLLNNYIYEIDMGSITVPEKYTNVYDYINTTVTLRVPFFSAITLDVENVIGHTISIKYTVDLYSGNVTMNVTSDFTGSIIYSSTQNIVTQIPFVQKQNNGIVNQLSNVYKYLIATPVIEVVRNIPYDDTAEFGKGSVWSGILGEIEGYCEVNKIQLNTSATNEEKEDIIDLLKEGVFIDSKTN
jgi:hypothetical protein